MDKNEFAKEYRAIVERSLSLVEKAICEGFLSLEEMIDEEKFIQRDIFEYGLRLAIDAIDYEHIDIILSNIIELEPDTDKKLLKTVQKEAVLQIQAGTGLKMLLMYLNSHVNIDVEETMKKYHELEKLAQEDFMLKQLEKLRYWKLKKKDKLEELELLEKWKKEKFDR